MTVVVLAGYKRTGPDKQIEAYYENQDAEVRTYNGKPGFADYTDINRAASGADIIVDLSKDDPDNYGFKGLIGGVAKSSGAEILKRSDLEERIRKA